MLSEQNQINRQFANTTNCSPALRSNPFYEPRSSTADSNTSDMCTKRRAPQAPSAGPNPAVAPGGPAPKTSAPEGTSTPPALAPSAVTAVIGRELASSSPKVNLPLHIRTLFTIESDIGM